MRNIPEWFLQIIFLSIQKKITWNPILFGEFAEFLRFTPINFFVDFNNLIDVL